LGALARIGTSSVGHFCVKRDLISVKRDLEGVNFDTALVYEAGTLRAHLLRGSIPLILRQQYLCVCTPPLINVFSYVLICSVGLYHSSCANKTWSAEMERTWNLPSISSFVAWIPRSVLEIALYENTLMRGGVHTRLYSERAT